MPSLSSSKILFIFGTRPEAIKLCPLINAVRASGIPLEATVCVTAQHREMLDQVLRVFRVEPEYDLNVMTPGQTLPALTARLLVQLEPVLRDVQPALVLVQGDTTSTLAGALAAFYARIPVAHVEAGLRTHDMHSPFPEEMNRCLTTRLAALHFAPTSDSADNLLREGVDSKRIFVTGNTGIDAVLTVKRELEAGTLPGIDFNAGAKKLVLVTAHRRESFGQALRDVCGAVSEIAARPDVQVLWPVHPNPNVREAVQSFLAKSPSINLVDPLPYVPFVDAMRKAHLILTDSGGVQEEAPSLGKPVLVLRDKTERGEAVKAGTVRLVGTDRTAIVRMANVLLDDVDEYRRMARAHNPYGDGTASVQIARQIAAFLAESVR